MSSTSFFVTFKVSCISPLPNSVFRCLQFFEGRKPDLSFFRVTVGSAVFVWHFFRQPRSVLIVKLFHILYRKMEAVAIRTLTPIPFGFGPRLLDCFERKSSGFCHCYFVTPLSTEALL